MKQMLFNLLYNGLLSKNVILPFSNGNRFILLLHDVSVPTAVQHHPVYSTHPKVFKKMLVWVKKNFKAIRLNDLMQMGNTQKASHNYISIVFDDGFLSVADVAAPIMSEMSIPYTVFVNQCAIEENWIWCSNILMALNQREYSYLQKLFDYFKVEKICSFSNFLEDPISILSNEKLLGDDYSIFKSEKFQREKVYLNREEIVKMMENGVQIGNHTRTHKHLSTCSDEVIEDEILGNQTFLENLLGEKIDHFAIPFGFHTTYNNHAITIAQKAHQFVYDTEKNRVKADQNLVPRIGLQNESEKKLYSYVNYPILKSVN